MDDDVKKGLIIAIVGAFIALFGTLCQTLLPIYFSSESSDFSINVHPINIEAVPLKSDSVPLDYLKMIDPSNQKNKSNSTGIPANVSIQAVHGTLNPYMHSVYLRAIYQNPDIYVEFDDPEGKPQPNFTTKMTVYIKPQNKSLINFPIIISGIGSNGKTRNSTIFVSILTWEDYVKRGYNLSLMGSYEEAVKAYDKAIELIPKNESPTIVASIWNNKGVVLQNQGKIFEALNAYDKAIDLNIPNELKARGWNNKGEALVSLRKYDGAITAFDNATTLLPSYGGAWLNKGKALKALGREKEANDAFAKANDLGYREVG